MEEKDYYITLADENSGYFFFKNAIKPAIFQVLLIYIYKLGFLLKKEYPTEDLRM